MSRFALSHCTPRLLTILVSLFVTTLAAVTDPIVELSEHTSAFRPGMCDPNTFTVSGISAGACMALQFEFAWSSVVRGAGLIASAPYQCAGGSLSGAILCLDNPALESPTLLLAEAQALSDAGGIDNITNIQAHTVMLFSGLIDTVVPQMNMLNVHSMFESLNVSRMTSYFNYTAEHAWVTSKYGNACSSLGKPFINNCNIDFGGRFLARALSDLGVSWNSTMGSVNQSNLFSFNQTVFGANVAANSMASMGFVYVPSACQQQQEKNNTKRCHLHMNLHGCLQSASNLGTQYVLSTELNEWAESNRVVVLYPQAAPNLKLNNPDACFDWWGYAGADYAQQTGAQQTVLRSIVRHFGGF